MDIDSDFSDLEKTPVKSKPVSKTGFFSPNAGIGLADDKENGSPAKKKGGTPKKKTIEEIYEKKSQYEHILLRPDTYIGSTERVTQKLWVYDEAGKKMVDRDVTYAPGLYKIFDEVLVNAADNHQRDVTCNKIKVNIDREAGTIAVWNNGAGIPIELHKKEGVYVPELIFGHLLTGSNFQDDDKKVVGGRNGYGAKLCNIFSSEFIVETQNKGKGKVYRQLWTDNMSKCQDPSIKAGGKTDWTRVTFKPDFAKFGMDSLDDDIIALMRKRVHDIAGCLAKSVKVYLDDDLVPVKSFQDYCNMYVEDKKLVYERVNDRWEVCICESDDGQPQQVSFCNSICTIKGGTHVDHVLARLVKPLTEALKKKKTDVKAHQIKSHIFVFVNALIENPAFDSQTKETLTLQASKFGSRCEISEAFIKKTLKSGLVEKIKEWAKFKEQKAWEKKGGTNMKRGRVTGIPKLDDANEAGGKNAEKCTLILTEGDSAKALAQAGISVIGADYYGVFPLKGKLLNVREASIKQLMENDEINNIIKILGLQKGKKYEDTKSLRYGHLMIMTDQDHDGSHIKGLVLNMIHTLWPSLLMIPGFLQEFVTPIVKATKGRETEVFFNLPEYRTWKTANNEGKGWTIKYYKGLGTSTDLEAKEYFSLLEEHKIDFEYEASRDDSMMQLAFDKKFADDRKEWLAKHDAEAYIDTSRDTLDIKTFVNDELVQFSYADCERSIPCAIDGLKPGQRKILYVCLEQKITKDYKVAQLAGAVANKAAYHHGEVSLMSTIVGMAQYFVGSHNINLLWPSGQFGTRRQGGKDAASARYIYTRLSTITRFLFREHDDNILAYLDDDGFPVEPKYYMPVIPMLLVNGSDGIGTGWSTSIPSHSALDLISNVERMLQDEEPEPMAPYFNGFVGSMEWDPVKQNYMCTGGFERVNENTIVVYELPVQMWTQSYKEMLEKGVSGTDKVKAWIKDYRENHTSNSVCFTITTVDPLPTSDAEIIKKFKLQKTISVSNFVAFDANGHIKKYNDALEIMKEFFTVRLEHYMKRKSYLADRLEKEWTKLANKVRFIKAVINKEIVVANRKKADLLAQLRKDGYAPCPPATKRDVTDVIPAADGSDSEDASTAGTESDYNYLLSMALWSLTKERVDKLAKEAETKEAELQELLRTDVKDMWRRDLAELREALEGFTVEQLEAERAGDKYTKGKGKGKGKKGKKGADSDDEWGSSNSKKTSSKKMTAKQKQNLLAEEAMMQVERPKEQTTKSVAPKEWWTMTKPKAASRRPAAKPKAEPKVKVVKEEDASASTKADADSPTKRARPAEKANVAIADDDSLEMSLSDAEDEAKPLAKKLAVESAAKPVAKKAPAKKAPAKKAPAKKAPAKKAAPKRVMLSDSEEEEDNAESSEDSVDMSVGIAARGGRSSRRAAARTNFAAMMPSDDDDSDDEEDESDDFSG